MIDWDLYFITQICKISPIAMALSVSMSVCLCAVGYSRERICHTIVKIKNVKNIVCIFLHFPSNGIKAKIVLQDFYVLFEGQTFSILISKKR